jgi:hypothetical protein
LLSPVSRLVPSGTNADGAGIGLEDRGASRRQLESDYERLTSTAPHSLDADLIVAKYPGYCIEKITDRICALGFPPFSIAFVCGE